MTYKKLKTKAEKIKEVDDIVQRMEEIGNMVNPYQLLALLEDEK